MAYVQSIGSLSLAKLAKQTPADFAEDLATLKGAGLSDFAANWLTSSVKQVYDAKIAFEKSENDAWNTWLSQAQVFKTASSPVFFETHWNRLPIPQESGVTKDYVATVFGSTNVTAPDYLAGVEKIRRTVLEGRKFNEWFKEVAPYYPLWPFPNVVAAERTVNGFPLVMAFRLDGATMNSEGEYNSYWNQFLPPQITDNGFYSAVFIKEAPDYANFLNQLKVFFDVANANPIYASGTGTRSYQTSERICRPNPNYGRVYSNWRQVMNDPYGGRATICEFKTIYENYVIPSWAVQAGLRLPYEETLGYPTENGMTVFNTVVQAAINSSSWLALSKGSGSVWQTITYAQSEPANAVWHLKKLKENEIKFRFYKPSFIAPPPPQKKRKWWQKVLSTYIPFIAPIIAIATGGLASGLVAFVGMKTGEYVSKEVGGIGGVILGGITSGAVGGFSQLAGFVPSASAMAPSYDFTKAVMTISPLPVPINQILGKGLDAYIQNYIGISPEVLSGLGNTLTQTAAIAASALAPKVTPFVLGGLTTVQNFDKLTTPSDWESFLPAAKTTALAFAPDYAKQIRVAYEIGKGLPTAIEGLSDVPKMIAQGMQFIGDVIVRAPELIGQVLIKSPELLAKGTTYTLTHAVPLALEGVQETGKVLIQAPELVYKGTAYTVTHAAPLVLEGVQETGKVLLDAPQLVLKGAEFAVVKGTPLVVEGLQETGKVFLEAPQLAVKGLEYAVVKSAPLVLEGLQETAKAVLEVPQLVLKGAAYTLDKAAPIVLEGLEEAGKAVLEVPNLVVKGMTYALDKAPALVVDVVENIPMPSMPSIPMSMVQIPSMNYQTTFAPIEIDVIRPITTVQGDVKVVTQEKVEVGTGASGEEIIHLPAMPIQDNTPLLLAMGGLAVLAITIAATE